MERNRRWLDNFSNFSRNECEIYMEENPDLPANDRKVMLLKEMAPRERIRIEAILEKESQKWACAAYCDTESAWYFGAWTAFSREDYTCSLIYRYIGAKEIADALR